LIPKASSWAINFGVKVVLDSIFSHHVQQTGLAEYPHRLRIIIISYLLLLDRMATYLLKNPRAIVLTINKELLALRAKSNENRPDFVRQESWRYRRLKEDSWRKPKGVDNHQRKQKFRGRPGLVKVGYGGPKAARGLHPSGFTDNLIHNVNDLQKLNPKTDGLRIAHGVGTKKRIEIVTVATQKKFKIFNARVKSSGSKS